MKRLNVPLILLVAGGLLASAVGMHLVHRWQVARHAQGLLRRADLSKAEGEHSKALRAMGQYLRYRPDDHDAYTRMALLMEESTQWDRADRSDFFSVHRALEKAIRQQPDNEELRRRAIEFYLRFRRTKDAVEHVHSLIRQTGGQSDPQLQLLLARCLVGGADIPRAMDVLGPIVGYDAQQGQFDASAALDAASIDAYALLAALLRESTKDPAAADAVIDQAVAANPDAWRAHSLRGEYLRRHYRRSGPHRAVAAADIRKAHELAPDEPEVGLLAAQVELEDNRLDEAARILDRGIQRHPQNDQFHRLRAALAMHRGEHDSAKAIADKGLGHVPGSGPLLLFRADLALLEGDFDAALASVERLPPGEQYRYYKEIFQAQILVRKGQWGEASDRLTEVLPQLVPTAGLQASHPQLAAERHNLAAKGYLWLAECRERRRQWDLQLEASRQALRLEPASAGAKFSEVRALASMGKMDEAERELAALRRMASRQRIEVPHLRAWETSFLAALQQRKPPSQRDWHDVEQRFLEHLSQRSDLDEPARAAAHVRLLLQQQRTDEAAARLQQARSEFPKDAGLLLAAVHVTHAREGAEAALEHLQRVQSDVGDTVDLRLHKGALLIAAQADGAEEPLAALEENTSHYSPAELDRLRRNLGALHQRSGNRAAARRLWRLAADANPADVDIRVGLFELARESGDGPQMAVLAEEIKSAAGSESAMWKFVEANRLLWSMQNNQAPPDALAAAARLVQEARSVRPTWYALSLLDADVALMAGNVDAAIEHLQAAVENGPAMPQVVRRLVSLLWKQQRTDEARRAMQQLAEAGGQGDLDERFRSHAEAMSGNLDDAIALARGAADASKNVDDYLWLAGLLSSAGQSGEAVAALRRAVELAPANEQAAIALVRELVLSGHHEEAEAQVRRMAIDLPQQRAASLLGLGYQLLGQWRTAENYFQQALAANPRGPAALRDLAALYLLIRDHEQAMPLLDRMIALGASAEDDHRAHFAWARRAKARLLAATGRYGDFQRAWELVLANAPRGGVLPTEDALFLATLAGSRQDLTSLRGGIEVLEQAGRSRSLSGAEQLALARLYERCGRWHDCEAVMTRLVAAFPRSEPVVASWCEMKLRRGDMTNVELLLRDLPDQTPRVQQVRARLLALQDKPERAAELIRSLVPPPEAEDRWQATLQLARFVEEIGLQDEAEKFFRACAEQSFQNSLILADFLARRGKLDESLDLCEQNLKGPALIAAISAGVNALAAGRESLADDAPQLDRVAAWLERGLRELPDSRELQMRRAAFVEMRGDHELAEGLYRKLLARPDLSHRERALVSNNLAVILAVRGECREAERLVEAALSELGPVAELLDTRAMAAMCRGDDASLAEAREDLEASLVTLDDPVIRFHLAQTLFHSGQADEARAALQAALAKGLSLRKLHVLERPRLAALAESLGVSESAQ